MAKVWECTDCGIGTASGRVRCEECQSSHKASEQAEIAANREERITAQGGPDGLDIGYEAGRQAREINPAAYYASPVERSDDNGCSCTPNNGPSCHNCR